MALNTLPAGAFADDAITADKINLANTFAFTGTVTGTPNDLVKISSANGTSLASLELTNVFTTTYNNYLLVGTFTPVNDGNDLKGSFMSGSTATSDSEYRYILRSSIGSSSSASQSDTRGFNTDHFRLNSSGISNSNNFGINVSVYIMNPMASSTTNTPGDPHVFGDSFHYADNNTVVRSYFGVNYQTSADYNGFKLIFSNNSIQLYNYCLYGFNK